MSSLAGQMFGHSLLEQSFRRRLRWPAVLAYVCEAIAVALVLLAPIVSTTGLPQLAVSRGVIPMGSMPRAASAPHAGQTHPMAPRETPAMLIFSAHPLPVHRSGQSGLESADLTPPCVVGICDGTAFVGSGGTFPAELLPAAVPRATVAPPRPPVRVRVSEFNMGQLLHRVEPVYPHIAIVARIQGPVELAAVIARDGSIENLRVVSGHPMLAPAAVDAVRQWRYRPYKLDGEPVEVETQITMNFILGK
jgi:protein TonB